MPRLWQCRDNAFDRLGEAHIEHLVRLIQHQRLELRQVAQPLVDQIQQPPRCRHEDVDSGLERMDLVERADTAEDRGDAERQMTAQALKARGDLRDQFARRRQNQDSGAAHGRPAGRCCKAMQQRQRESGGLAGACLRHAEHVAAPQQHRDRLRLNGGRAGIAFLGQRAQQRWRQTEIGERHGHGRAAPPALSKGAPIGLRWFCEPHLRVMLHRVNAVAAAHGGSAGCGRRVRAVPATSSAADGKTSEGDAGMWQRWIMPLTSLRYRGDQLDRVGSCDVVLRWCPPGDSNPHARKPRILSPLRLPFRQAGCGGGKLPFAHHACPAP
jgi:hypothetical protein